MSFKYITWSHLIALFVFGAILQQFQSCSRPAKLDQNETPKMKSRPFSEVGGSKDFGSSRNG